MERGKIFVVIVLLVAFLAAFLIINGVDKKEGYHQDDSVDVVEIVQEIDGELEAEEFNGKIHLVDIRNFVFVKSITRISEGDRVVWINRDIDLHSVVSNDRIFDSGELATGESFGYNFNEAGRYAYYSDLQPYMKGTIVVIS